DRLLGWSNQYADRDPAGSGCPAALRVLFTGAHHAGIPGQSGGRGGVRLCCGTESGCGAGDDPDARYAAVHPGPQLSAGRDGSDDLVGADQGTGCRDGVDTADLHRTGVEYGVQFLFVATQHPAGDDGGSVRVPPELVAEADSTGTAVRGDRPG